MRHFTRCIGYMARRAQVVTRRILHRMYHQCGNTDTYLSPPPPRPPPQLLTLGESRPNRPTHSSTTLPFRRILLPSLSFRLDSRQILRVPTLSRYRDIPSMIYTRLSASCSTQAEEREREKESGRCARLHVYRQRTRGRSWTSRRRRRFLVTRLC